MKKIDKKRKSYFKQKRFLFSRLGLSLVEVVIAASVLAVLLSGGYYATRSSRKVEKFMLEDSYVRERITTVLDQFIYDKLVGIDPDTGDISYYSLSDVSNESYSVTVEDHPTIDGIDVRYSVETTAPGWTPGGSDPEPMDSLKKVSLEIVYTTEEEENSD